MLSSSDPYNFKTREEGDEMHLNFFPLNLRLLINLFSLQITWRDIGADGRIYS